MVLAKMMDSKHVLPHEGERSSIADEHEGVMYGLCHYTSSTFLGHLCFGPTTDFGQCGCCALIGGTAQDHQHQPQHPGVPQLPSRASTTATARDLPAIQQHDSHYTAHHSILPSPWRRRRP